MTEIVDDPFKSKRLNLRAKKVDYLVSWNGRCFCPICPKWRDIDYSTFGLETGPHDFGNEARIVIETHFAELTVWASGGILETVKVKPAPKLQTVEVPEHKALAETVTRETGLFPALGGLVADYVLWTRRVTEKALVTFLTNSLRFKENNFILGADAQELTSMGPLAVVLVKFE